MATKNRPLELIPSPGTGSETQLNPHQPLYTQIKDILRSRILEGRYQPLQQMPSESELIASFGVSRITVRQALGDLQGEGLIFRVHGKGTYVSKPRAFQDLGSLQGFGMAMRQMGYETHSRILAVNTLRLTPGADPAHAQIQETLQLAKNAKVTELQRLRFLNRDPISLDITYLPHALGTRLARADLINRDVFEVLENDLGQTLGHADLRINSILSDETASEQLQVQEGSPILFIERTVYTAAGAPLEFERLYYRGDAFQFKFRVERNTVQTD